MDRPGLIFIIMPIVILLALFTGIALPFIAASGRSHAGGGWHAQMQMRAGG